MTLGANLGRILCIALTSCAGFALSIVVCPVLYFLGWIFQVTFFERQHHAGPLWWERAVIWMIPVCACAGGFLAWLNTRPGRLHNKPPRA